MLPVATKFHDQTFTYTQLAREGMYALYEQQHKQGDVRRYEVVRLRIRPPHTWPDGHTTPEHEAYPGATAWGTDGWTFHTRPEAEEALRQLVQRA